MRISKSKREDEAAATGVRFEGAMLVITLADGRELSLPYTKLDWLNWLAKAAPKQRANWSIEPQGFAIWWDDLDDGIEVIHALTHKRLSGPSRAVLHNLAG